MQEPVIYHNAQCSKSREALEILLQKGFKPIIIEYLKHPLDLEQLQDLSSHFPLNEFVRTTETIFKELDLSLDDKNTLLKSMAKHPKLMQRPIVTYKGKAVIGRPPEKILTIIGDE